MLIFKEHDFNVYFNKKDYERKAVEYLKKHPCCDKHNCTHPPHQSDCELWKDKDFLNFAEKVASIIFKMYEKKFNLSMRMWVYFQEKNSILKQHEWHNHQRDFKNKEISFIVYLSDTDLGTVFKDKNNVFTLKPKKNHLYLWDSRYEHSPQTGKNHKDRVVVAGDCLISA